MISVFAALPLAGLAMKAGGVRYADFNRSEQLALANEILVRSGLQESERSRLTISGKPAASVFYHPGCRGLVIVAPLPPTAQSFDQVIAGFGEEISDEGFVFQGKVFENYPWRERLITRLVNSLKVSAIAAIRPSDPLYSFKEIGECNLAKNIAWQATFEVTE